MSRFMGKLIMRRITKTIDRLHAIAYNRDRELFWIECLIVEVEETGGSHILKMFLFFSKLGFYFCPSALSNYNENNCLRVQNCRELLGKIKGKIVFQWVPSHCGVWGNERADFLAKRGTGILQNFSRDLTLHSAKLEIKMIFRESFRLTASRAARDKPWSTLCKKSHGIPISPRAAAVAKFRLLTRHDCLCTHLFRFNLVQCFSNCGARPLGV
ncbi:uncharacterized protein LOC103524116 [Trichonephila clavipes]|nr:uncharacterized protein LOC103524116 [Trichonephila clavipes]